MLGDKEHNFVAAIHSDQRQADSGISCGGFDDGASGLEQAFFLGAANDADGGTIFYASTWIQVFQLGVDFRCAWGNNSLQMKDRSFAHEIGYVVSDAQAGAFDALGSHSTGYGSVGVASTQTRVLGEKSAQGDRFRDRVQLGSFMRLC